jgi:hypothetical protein
LSAHRLGKKAPQSPSIIKAVFPWQSHPEASYIKPYMQYILAIAPHRTARNTAPEKKVGQLSIDAVYQSAHVAIGHQWQATARSSGQHNAAQSEAVAAASELLPSVEGHRSFPAKLQPHQQTGQ